MGLALGINLILCTSVVKGLKLKVRKFWGQNPSFVEVTGEKLVGGGGFLPPPPILNRVKGNNLYETTESAYLSKSWKFKQKAKIKQNLNTTKW